ncbi:thyroid receptor-interacting protein 11-like, partial [Clarias magur]
MPSPDQTLDTLVVIQGHILNDMVDDIGDNVQEHQKQRVSCSMSPPTKSTHLLKGNGDTDQFQQSSLDHSDDMYTPRIPDPVQTGSVDDSPDSMPDVGGVSVKPTVSENPEEENQKVEVSSERAELEDRVRELEELLSDAHRECVRKNKVFRSRAKRKYKKAMKSIAKLQKENSDLKSSVNTLQDSVQHLGILLSETHTQSAQSSRLYESEVNLRRYMQAEYDKSEENYNEKITSLRFSLAEAERQYERSMESNAQLEGEISGLRSEVSRLQGSVEQLGAELSDTHTRCNELTSECISREHEMSILQSECNKMKEILLKDCEREPEVQRMLLAQNDKLKELLKQKEELLKDSLAEAERKSDQAKSSKAQLESDLRSEVNTLQGSVQKMEEELSKKHRDCEEMKREIEAYRMQKLQGEVMRESLEQFKKLLKECMQERESHSVLTSQCNLMALTHSEDALKLSLVECEKNCEQAEVINAQLVNEKSVLMSRLNKLQASVQGLSNLLSETHMKCETAVK